MIKTGGINVAPAEVEEVLMRQKGVKQAYVIGVPDEVRDEIIAALVVPEGPQPEGFEARLHDALKSELSAYKRPRLLRLVQEKDLPLTTTGKVQKNRLSDLFEKA